MTTAKRRFANIRHDLRTELPKVYAEPALPGHLAPTDAGRRQCLAQRRRAPRIAHEELVDRLVSMGVVCLSPDDPYLYRMPGLDMERDGEVEAGRQNAMKRWEKEGKGKPPEPDYRPMMRAFYRDPVAPHRPPKCYKRTDKRTDVTRRGAAA